MNTPRPTPETDAAEEKYGNGNAMHAHCHDSSHLDGDFADFAKRLERERDEAREQAAELLEALELLLDQFDFEIHNEYDGTGMLNSRLSEANHARAAIAKAKGGQP